MTTQSFIAEAISSMADKMNVSGDIARAVESQQHEHVANRIALTYVQFNRERLEASKAEKATGVRGRDPVAKPEQLLSFVQNVMNQVCWNARRLCISNGQEEYLNGIDFSQDTGEAVGVYTATENVSSEVDQDFITLNNLQTYLAAQMSYLTDIEPLYYFSQQEKIDEQWVPTHQCMSFDDAFTAMSEIVELLNEQQEANQTAEAASMDFTATA